MQSGWSAGNRFLTARHFASYPRRAADPRCRSISLRSCLRCFSQRRCGESTRAGQPGYPQGCAGANGLMPLSFPFGVTTSMFAFQVRLAGELDASGRSQSHRSAASFPGDRLPSNRTSRFVCSFGLDRPDYFVHPGAPELVGNTRMFEIRFVFLGAIRSGIDQSRAVLAQGFEE